MNWLWWVLGGTAVAAMAGAAGIMVLILLLPRALARADQAEHPVDY